MHFAKTLDYYLASVNKAFKFSKVMLTLVQNSYRHSHVCLQQIQASAVSGKISPELSLTVSLEIIFHITNYVIIFLL